MSTVNLEQIKKLRKETKAGVMACRCALEECQGDFQKAKKWLWEKGITSADKKSERETNCGLVEAYIHADGRLGALIELCSETDFVARNEEFKKLAHELAMQVAAMNPKDEKELLKQPWIRDGERTVGDLIKETIAKLGENIVVKRIFRCELGKI